jgi:hypothetical protein
MSFSAATKVSEGFFQKDKIFSATKTFRKVVSSQYF